MQTVIGGLEKFRVGSIQTKLDRFLFSYSITSQSTTEISPTKITIGSKLCYALDSMKPDLNWRIKNEQERQRNAHNRHCHVRSFQYRDEVYVQNYCYSGTKWVLVTMQEIARQVSYTVRIIPMLECWFRHHDQLRKQHKSK